MKEKELGEPIRIKPLEEIIARITTEAADPRAQTTVNPEEADFQERLHLERKRDQEIRRLTAENTKLEEDNEGRKVLRDSVFAVTVIWMFLVLAIVWQSGTGHLRVSDTVLITLITTTTANVFGFLYIVVKYLFNETRST